MSIASNLINNLTQPNITSANNNQATEQAATQSENKSYFGLGNNHNEIKEENEEKYHSVTNTTTTTTTTDNNTIEASEKIAKIANVCKDYVIHYANSSRNNLEQSKEWLHRILVYIDNIKYNDKNLQYPLTSNFSKLEQQFIKDTLQPHINNVGSTTELEGVKNIINKEIMDLLDMSHRVVTDHKRKTMEVEVLIPLYGRKTHRQKEKALEAMKSFLECRSMNIKPSEIEIIVDSLLIIIKKVHQAINDNLPSIVINLNISTPKSEIIAFLEENLDYLYDICTHSKGVINGKKSLGLLTKTPLTDSAKTLRTIIRQIKHDYDKHKQLAQQLSGSINILDMKSISKNFKIVVKIEGNNGLQQIKRDLWRNHNSVKVIFNNQSYLLTPEGITLGWTGDREIDVTTYFERFVATDRALSQLLANKPDMKHALHVLLSIAIEQGLRNAITTLPKAEHLNCSFNLNRCSIQIHLVDPSHGPSQIILKNLVFDGYYFYGKDVNKLDYTIPSVEFGVNFRDLTIPNIEELCCCTKLMPPELPDYVAVVGDVLPNVDIVDIKVSQENKLQNVLNAMDGLI